MKKPDLTYWPEGLWMRFHPVTKDGESPWRQIAENDPDGQAVIFSLHMGAVLAGLRKAGYVVRKARPGAYREPDAMTDDELLEALAT